MAILWPIGALAALSTIAFGLLFGELFGDLGHEALGLTPIWLDRREAVVPLLIVAISLGVAQIGLGLALGVVNAARLRHRREAWGRAALLAALGGGVVGIVALAGAVPAWVGGVAAAVLVIALVTMTATLGLAGPIEVMGLVGNVLSYARLMAIGLASVMLALIANRMGGLTENVLIGVVIAVCFHALAFVLGFFDASVQGLRLHYVEFFSRFVEPGGTRYDPFAAAIVAAERDGDAATSHAGGI
jgi:V/A-type H+-transporting ATPase subunit I